MAFNSAEVCFASKLHDIKKKRKETKAKIQRLKILETQETNKMIRNQQKLENNERALQNSKQRYDKTQSKLTNLEYKLAVSKADFAKHESLAKQRIRQIYKKERMGAFILIMSSENINTFLDRIYYQSLIAKNDKRNLEITKQKAVRIARLKEQLEDEKNILSSSIDDMNARKKQIKSAINDNEAMIYKLKHDRAAFEKAERELARQSQIIEGMISKNTKKSTVTAAKGAFLRPCGGCITSYFGYRNHPIFHRKIYHSGIDIGAPTGTPIKAANSGRVIYTGWYGGYGQVVIIDHGAVNGKPTSTLYAHQSRIAVANGQNVSRGKVIGYVGSTGYSTGPHLHFEVRINGKPVNPLNYI
ncbi:MAG: murein hydrolase activator EnvC family protein [Candidatus Gastranaerophilaceae bacterium]